MARWIKHVIIALCLLNVMMLIFGIPVRYNILMQVCDGLECSRRTLNSEDLTVLLNYGWTHQAYALFQIFAELIYILFMGPLALFLLFQNKHPNQRMFYLTAYTFLSLSTILMPEITLNLAQSHSTWYLLYQILKGVSWIGFFYFLFSFPNGDFTPDWLSWFISVPCLSIFLWLLTGNSKFDPAEEYGIIVSVGLLWVGVIAQIYRYRKVASAEEHQQTKWMLFGLILVVIVNFIWVMVFQAFQVQSAEARVWVHTFGFLFLITGPLSITFALTMGILRYRLWDIDIIINRTLVYSIMTAIVILLYILIVTSLNSILSSNNLIPSLMATGVVAVSFQSIRERIQLIINRLMFGQRDEPQAVLMELSAQLSTAILPDDLLIISMQTIAQTLKLPYVAILIDYSTEQKMQREYGTNKTPTGSFPLIYQNENVGELVVGQRSPNEKLNASDQAVLSSIAQQMGAIVYAVRLQSDLQIARERLVIAREEERRRIRRDLHDGLGPALASQPLQFDIAIEHISNKPELAIEVLKEMKQNAKGFIHDVRRVIHDLRPPTLDELGLVESLKIALSQSHSQNGLHIHFHLPTDLQNLSAAVEVAAYRIVMEAVTNVRKHAEAKDCHVKFHYTENRSLQIFIEDNGTGLPEKVTSGVGLQSMRERCEELGGKFGIETIEPHGTRINATLPLISKRENMT